MRARQNLVLILSLLKSVIYKYEPIGDANKYNGSLIFSGDQGLVVQPLAFQLVNLKTSLTLEKTQCELWLTFPETE